MATLTKSSAPWGAAPTMTIAERRELAAGKLPAQPQPVEPAWLPRPLQSDIDRLSTYPSNPAGGEHRAGELAKETLRAMRKIAPASFAKAEELRQDVAEKSAAFHELINASRAAIGEIENLLLTRHGALQSIQTETGLLNEATAVLESPDSVNSPAEKLALCQQRQKFLPTRIAELHDAVAEAESAIIVLEHRHNIDLPALMAAMLSRAKNHEGAILDRAMHDAARRPL